MLDNSNTLTISSTLTKIGKKRLTEGKFKISKVAIGDDGINYKLINNNLSDDNILIRRTPLFDVWKDGHMGIKNKVRLDKPSTYAPNTSKFDYNVVRLDDIKVSIGGDDKNFPEVETTSGNKEIAFYGGSASDLYKRSHVSIQLIHENIFGSNTPSRFITATLYDTSYFDIAVSVANVNQYTEVARMEEPVSGMVDDNAHNINMMNLMDGGSPQDPITNMSTMDRNYLNSYFLLDENKPVPKVINVLTNQGQTQRNSFTLYYKGNFPYKDVGTQNYETVLELFDEVTGRTEYIELSIVPLT